MKKIHDFSAQAHLALAKLSAAAEAKRSLIAFKNHVFTRPLTPALSQRERGQTLRLPLGEGWDEGRSVGAQPVVE
jgi:hypothetical protein